MDAVLDLSLEWIITHIDDAAFVIALIEGAYILFWIGLAMYRGK